MSSLAIVGRVPCERCERTFSNSGALRLHMSKVHLACVPSARTQAALVVEAAGIEQDCKDATQENNREFFCPEPECPRGVGGKPFPRMGQLRQHWGTVHAERQFVCRLCSRAFGMQDACLRHQVRSHVSCDIYFFFFSLRMLVSAAWVLRM
jgi:hypothetical protein